MWPETSQTEGLLKQARQGEAAAVDQLLAKHRESLCRMIGMRLDPAIAGRVDASDVVQDVLLEASRRLSDYLRDPVMPFHLWLRQIAKDHVIDAHRKHHLAQRRTVDRERPIHVASLDRSSREIAVELINRELTPASAAIRQEMENRFQEALQLLEEEDRDMILMRHFEQLTNQEAAAALSLSEPAASMRYLRAMRRLKKLLSGEGVD